MKKTFAISVLALALALAPYFATSIEAASKAEQYLGDTVTCLDTVRLKESRILDNQTIAFKMLDGTMYLNRLTAPCPGLYISGGFSYESSLPKLCVHDIITVVEKGSTIGSSCLLGDKFWEFNKEGTFENAIKALKNGLLEELVSEDAFQ